MKKIVRFCKRWWWAFLASAGMVLGVAVSLLVPRRKSTPIPKTTNDLPRPTFAERARVEVSRVRLEGDVEKARIQARTEAHITQLNEIETTGKTDPEAGRRMLAVWIKNNL